MMFYQGFCAWGTMTSLYFFISSDYFSAAVIAVCLQLSSLIVFFFFSFQPDRTYDLKIGQPTVSYFLKQAAGIEKGAAKTGETTALLPHWAHNVKAAHLLASVWAWFDWCNIHHIWEHQLRRKEVAEVLCFGETKENYGFSSLKLRAGSSLFELLTLSTLFVRFSAS